MKKLGWWISSLVILLSVSCTTREELKEISGTFEFKDAGKHSFFINADHIEATIKLVGTNGGETVVIKNVTLDRNAEYTAIIAGNNPEKTELLNNLVVAYEAKPGNIKNYPTSFIRIDWVGFN